MAVCLGLFLIALVPRVLDPGRPITWDEPKWVNRSLRFAEALHDGDLRETFQVGHPGVTTMWLSGLGMTAWCRIDPAACTGVPQLSASSSGTYASEAALKSLPGVLPAARLPIAAMVAATVVGIYLLARRLVGRRAALVGATLVAIDPFFLAHSRVVQLDAMNAAFATLSLLALLVGLATSSRWALALSAVCAALAVLSKSSALFLLPFAGVVLVVWLIRPGQTHRPSLTRTALIYVAWVALAAATAFVVWPALWVDAMDTIRQVWEMGAGYAQEAHDNQNFFLGRLTEDPGSAFYPVATLFRLTPVACLGLVGLAAAGLVAVASRLAARRTVAATEALVGQRWPVSRQTWTVAALTLYVILFAVFMTIGAKKFDRYLLAVFPLLDLLAAVGLVWWLGKAQSWVATQRPQIQLLPLAALVALVGAQALAVWSYHPYYLAYYNPLLGGGTQAAATVLVGWGEGMDLVADYLNAQPDAADSTAVAWVEPGFTPLYHGHTMDFLSFDSLADIDYVVFYVSDLQRRLHESAHAIFDQLQPEHVVRLHGIEYARIYKNDHARLVDEYLAQRARPGDAILLGQPSVLQRRHQGPLPVLVASPAGAEPDAAAIETTLATAATAHDRVWYVDYGGACDAESEQRFAAVMAGEAFDQHLIRPYGVTLTGVQISPPPTSTVTSLSVDGASFGDLLRVDSLAFGPPKVASGTPVGIAVTWHSLADLSAPLAAKLILRDAADRVVATADQPALDGNCQPTTAWLAGTSDRDWHLLTVPAGTPPGTYQLSLEVYDQDSGGALPVGQPDGAASNELALGPVEVLPRTTPPDLADLDLDHSVDAEPMAGIRLLGYKLSDLPMTPGEQRRLTLFWLAESDIAEDLEVRVQWQDESGHTWHESRLSNAAYPTSGWRAGDDRAAGLRPTVDEAARTDERCWAVDLSPATAAGRRRPGVTVTGIELATLTVQAPERQFEMPDGIAHRQPSPAGRGGALAGLRPRSRDGGARCGGAADPPLASRTGDGPQLHRLRAPAGHHRRDRGAGRQCPTRRPAAHARLGARRGAGGSPHPRGADRRHARPLSAGGGPV